MGFGAVAVRAATIFPGVKRKQTTTEVIEEHGGNPLAAAARAGTLRNAVV
jgi:hypothetical protein